MNFDDKNVEDLLTASHRYRVPDYQRGYAWKTLQLEDFWNDLNEASADAPLYLGTLILQKATTLGEPRQIVDGQQRLTTISLLLVACRNLAAQNGWPQANTLAQTLAFQNIATAEIDLLRLEPGQNIDEAYRHIVTNLDWDEESFPDNIDGRKARILKSNYRFLKTKLATYNREALQDLIGRLLHATFFLVIEIDDALQAFDVFERTNARGTPLNIADLLKNRLFAEESSIPDLRDRWDKVVRESENMLPRVFKYFDALRNGHNTSRTVLFQHLRAQSDALGADEFLKEMEVFSRFLNTVVAQKFSHDPSLRIVNDSSFDFLYGDEVFFKRVKRSLDALSLFKIYVPLPLIYASLAALQRYSDTAGRTYTELKSEFLKTLNTIECFHFVNNGVCTTPTNRSEQLYAVTAKEIFASETIASCKEHLRVVQDGLREIGLADSQTFVEAFSQFAYSSSDDKPWIAYIFDRLHQDSFTRTPSVALYEPQSEDVINRTYEVEHIAPVSTWEGDENVLNNIGNLLILTKQTNQDAGSLPLAEKIEIYRGRRFDNLQPVEEFVEYAGENHLSAMTPDVIAGRARAIAQQAYDKVWNPWSNHR